MSSIRVLIVEDNDDDAALLARAIRRGGIDAEFRRVEDREALAAALAWPPHVIIADFVLPTFSAVDTLAMVASSGADIPVVIVSGAVGEEVAVSLMRTGAADCVMKSGMSRLAPALERVVRDAEVRRRQREADERERRFAWLDIETGLPNRNRLLEELRLRGEAGEAALLCVLSLDRGREIQRTLGLRVVDKMIQGLARRLLEVTAGRGWFLARVGPRDFAVLLPGEGEGVDDSFIRELDHVSVFDTLVLDVRVCGGFALAETAGDDAADLLRHAEAALEQAMAGGRRVAHYRAANDPWSPRRLRLINDLSHAAARGELRLVCQPRVDLSRGSTPGCEALLRWEHPALGPIPPMEFIPLAEGTGQIRGITRWVIREAARIVAGWRGRGMHLSLGVNISADGFSEGDLVGDIQSALQAERLDHDALDVELTESALMTDPSRAQQVLLALRDLGIRTFLDDFGTGYSSLAYLRSLPLSALKIDRVFVTGDLLDRADLDIVRSTIQLAHNLGLRVVAEGVETLDALQRLTALCCDEVQGYHVARPMPPDAVAGWLATSSWGAR